MTEQPLYLHGLPGSAAELAIAGVDLPVLGCDQPSFAQLALSLPQGLLHLIGFSLGAACALRLAALAPEKVTRLTLISAAAPLELGAFLPQMAGRAVFRAATSHGQLSALTRVQSTLARISPGFFTRLLLQNADPADQALFAEAQARAALQKSLREGLTQHRAAYLREITAYVQPWARHLAFVRCPVTLHHGTEDRWAPVTMAQALADALPDATLHRYDGLGHYSTLRKALTETL